MKHSKRLFKEIIKQSKPLTKEDFPFTKNEDFKKITESVCEIDRYYFEKMRCFGVTGYHREAVEGEWPNDHKINSVHVVEYSPGVRTRHPYYDPKYKKGGIKINKLKNKLNRSIFSLNN